MDSTRRVAVQGDIPSPYAIPNGCRFHTRCRFAEDRCRSVDPDAADLGPDHVAWCHVLPRRAAEVPATP